MSDQPGLERAVIVDRRRALDERISALGTFVDTGAAPATVAALARQIDEELNGDDTRFVIYLIGALRRIYDRGAVDVFIDLLHRPIDVSFRSQSLLGLRELYRHSVRHAGHAQQSAASAPAAAARHLGMVDENFVVHGADVTVDDRRRIAQALQSVADDASEITFVRDEARECYATCLALSALIPE